MLAASQHITATVTGNATIMALLTEGFYWELGPEGTNVPFANYTLVETRPKSKDYEGEYRVSIFIWAETLTESATIADVMKNELQPNWKFESAQNGYTDTDAKEAYIEIVFTFNL